MDINAIAALTRMSPDHERNMLAAVRKGYNAARRNLSLNPYQQANYHEAWQFGHDRCKPTVEIEEIESAWLEQRQAHGDRFAKLLGPSEPASEPQPVRIEPTTTRSNVEPFPVRGAKSYVDMLRSHLARQTIPLNILLAQHKERLQGYGCTDEAIERDIAELNRLLTASPTNGGTPLCMAA